MPLLPLAFAAFFAFGVLLALPGALQPAFAAAFGLDMAQSARLASVLSLGIGAGVLASGPLADRLPRRRLFTAAALLSSVAAALAAAASGAVLLGGALLLLGLGAGSFETVLNAAVPESLPERAAARTSVVHAAATLGAAAGALLLEAAARASSWQATCGGLALAFAAVAVLGAATRFPAPPAHAASASARVRLPAAALAPFAIAGAAYVGLETAFSALLPPYAEALGLGATRGARGMTAFWLGLFVARVAFWRADARARTRELVLGGAVSALLFALGAALGAHWIELWSAAIGLALGVVFPVLVVLSGDVAPLRRASALSWVVAAGSLGGALVPWLAGEAGTALGAGAAIGVLALVSGLIAAAARAASGELAASSRADQSTG